ncbi:MAG: hypothetical protein ACI4Q9_04430 [Candidatus Methanomethylophilaceae archaeon]
MSGNTDDGKKGSGVEGTYPKAGDGDSYFTQDFLDELRGNTGKKRRKSSK